MRTSSAERLARQPGHDVAWWNERIAAEPGGRLLDGRSTVGGGLNLRIPLQSVDDLDDNAVELFRRRTRPVADLRLPRR